MDDIIAILTISAQLGVLGVMLSIRQRFYCFAEYALVCSGLAAITLGTVVATSGPPSMWLKLFGWYSFLIGLLVQYVMPRPAKVKHDD